MKSLRSFSAAVIGLVLISAIMTSCNGGQRLGRYKGGCPCNKVPTPTAQQDCNRSNY